MTQGTAAADRRANAMWLWRQYRVEPQVQRRELLRAVRAVLAFVALVTIGAVTLTPAHPPHIPDDVAADGRVTA